MEREGRKRLRPWLWRHTEAGDYGLKWVDKEEGIFRIPWPRQSSRGLNKDNCQVFKEWAKFTSRYRDGEPDDYPGWKTRIRTALTKLSKDFEELSHLHKKDDIENPYRVYRFRTVNSPRDGAESSPSPRINPSSSQSEDGSVSSPCSNPSPNSNFHEVTSRSFVMAGNIPNIIEADNEEITGNASLHNTDVVSDSLIYNPHLCSDFMSTDFHQDFGACAANETKLHSCPSDLDSVESGNLVGKIPSSELNCYKNSLDSMNNGEKTQDSVDAKTTQISQPKQARMHYQIFYLDDVVKEGDLYDDKYSFHFGAIPNIENMSPEIFGPKDAKNIQFPDVSIMKRSINSKQQELMVNILKEMNRGFLLKYHEGDIYAQRLCRTRIYATTSTMDNELLDRKSKAPTKIFDLNQFRENHLGDNKRPPVAILTFAQELKLDTFKTLLMHIKITSLEAQSLLPKSNSDGSLQISDFNTGDELLQPMCALSL